VYRKRGNKLSLYILPMLVFMLRALYKPSKDYLPSLEWLGAVLPDGIFSNQKFPFG
jgi:hypothetical protein